MVFTFIAFACTAFADDSISFNLSSDTVSTKTGTQFTVTVIGQNIRDLDAYEIHMAVNMDKLDFIKAVSNIPNGYMVTPKANGNEIILAFAKMGNAATENGNISLCSVTFEGKAEGTANVTLESIKLLNGILEETNYYVGKTVTITITSGQTTTVPPESGKSGNKNVSNVTVVNEGIISVQEKVNANGIVTADISTSDIQSAIDKSKDGIVRVKVEVDGDAKEVKVNIPAQQLRMAADKQIRKIEVDTELSLVSISTDILKNSIGITSSNVQLSVSKADKSALSDEVKQIVGDNVVYDFNLSVDGIKISSFNGSHDVTVAINYTLKAGEDPGKVVIYYINDNGKLEIVKNGKYNSAIGKVVFSPKHFSKYVAIYNDVTFSDIANVSWAKASIEALAAREIINGVGDGTFKPDSKVTRSEFVKILMQAFDLADDNAECSLSDVKKGTWYYSSIAAAQKLGIIKGKSDGSFGINDEITRQDMAVMIYRAAQLIKADLNSNASVAQFADKSEIAAYAVDAVMAMQKAGLINGIGDGRFAPKGQATRAQAAVIIYRLFNLVK